jgi:prolyl oligopeptidase
MTFRILPAFLLLALSALAAENSIKGANGITLPTPPPTVAKPVTENLHGTTLTDPYRWLEDRQSPETSAWIDAQMKYSEQYLSQVKIRPAMAEELGKFIRVETYNVPMESHGNFFFMKRLADENQQSIYIRRGLHAQDERLVDPTKLSADQNTSLEIDDISRDGSLLVYGVRSGGADEAAIRILDVAQRQDLSDSLPSARYFGVQLNPDKKGLYYSRVDPKETLVFYHQLGTPAAGDKMIFGKSFEGETFGPMQLIGIGITDNQRYLIVEVDNGVPAKRQDIYVKDLRKPDAPVRPIIHGIDNRFTPVNSGDDFFVMTDYQAPNYRVIKIDLNHPQPDQLKTIVPEGNDVISEIAVVGGRLFVTDLHDVVTETRIFSLDGKPAGRVTYPRSVPPLRSTDAKTRSMAFTASNRSSFHGLSITTTCRPAKPRSSPSHLSPSTPTSTK